MPAMRWWCLLVVLAGGCQKIFGLQTFDPPHYHYAKTITITQPTDTTLEDFPVSIVLAADPELAAHAAADGSDLVFYDGQAVLPAEIVQYDRGTLDAWVAIPSLPPGTTTLQLLYDGPKATRETPWSPTAIGVWHASEQDLIMRDHGVHEHDVTVINGSTSPPTTPAIAGDGRQFNGTTDRLCGTADADGSLMFGTGSFSFEVWVNADRSARTRPRCRTRRRSAPRRRAGRTTAAPSR